VGVNPKINNLMPAFGMAKYDILWVIDSNAQVVPDTMARSVDSLTHTHPSKPRVGLVHHVPYAIASAHDSTIGTQLERAFLNTNHAKMYIALNTVAVESCVMGKSNLYRRSDIDKIMGTRTPIAKREHNWNEGNALKGLPSVGRFACEDAKIGESIWHELGLSHSLSSDVVTNVLGPMSLLSYVDRRARWIRVRKHTVPAATLVEPFQECILTGLIASWAISFLMQGNIPSWVIFLLHMCLFLAIDLEVRYVVTSTPFESSSERWAFILAWLGRELLAFPIWIYAMCGSHISWRGVSYRVLGDGEMQREEAGSRSKLRRLFSRGPTANGYERLSTHG
jgi:ceramide glucosyltransferase